MSPGRPPAGGPARRCRWATFCRGPGGRRRSAGGAAGLPAGRCGGDGRRRISRSRTGSRIFIRRSSTRPIPVLRSGAWARPARRPARAPSWSVCTRPISRPRRCACSSSSAAPGRGDGGQRSHPLGRGASTEGRRSGRLRFARGADPQSRHHRGPSDRPRGLLPGQSPAAPRPRCPRRLGDARFFAAWVLAGAGAALWPQRQGLDGNAVDRRARLPGDPRRRRRDGRPTALRRVRRGDGDPGRSSCLAARLRRATAVRMRRAGPARALQTTVEA